MVRALLARNPSGDRYRVTRLLACELAAQGALPAGCSVEELARSLARAYGERCAEAIAVCDEIPGATAALRSLADRGLPLFVNTGTPTSAAAAVLRRRGLDGLFRGVLGAEGSKLENLRAIAERVGARPEQLLFVGDSEDDRAAAEAFGCPFVGVALADLGRFHREPEHWLPDLAGLPELADRLAS